MRVLAPLSFVLMGAALAYIGLKPPVPTPPAPKAETVVTSDQFGIEMDAYAVDIESIDRGDTFSDLMAPFQVSGETIANLVEAAKPVFDVRKLLPGRDLHVYTSPDSLREVALAVYEASATSYVVFDFGDSLHARVVEREVRTATRSVSGQITSSLYETLEDLNVDPFLAVRLSEVYAWQIDFGRLHQGDRFTVAYEEKYVEDKRVGLGRVLAAKFTHGTRDFEAFLFANNEAEEYFDGDGNSLRKAFLIAPVEYKRISSRFSGRRFHPVQKRYKAHLGTDYAANYGTPIRATGDGVITKAEYGRANGRYVKIRHNGTYSTQYLHMQKIASGMRPGVAVKQGQVIGYVGSSGLANGPHVCYRFWKNGQQVDHLREDLPSVDPLPEEAIAGFEIHRDRWRAHLAAQEPVMPRIAAASLGPGTD
ncbi:MAG: peptidoglycan DD-metalloendopeptidase family protein [Rhodothermales bacterium]|nr:peptidoglycan DD-metalloendopeptidase family protein [Rhodothermales bacterium]MBO6780941.1 peptidoglycan DD-metalloendopeptidase family protein [Rhodothermales bacterium]